ncbi:MAG: DUF1501 domain-containing protein [Planctomycetes bacterium]|nr:DUF1501 domain-containing protein [Planctomycetota bacterium]
MLTIFDRDDRFNRRSFLNIGSLALGGLSLTNLLQTKASAAAEGRRPVLKDRSVIFLFLHGGPSQIETFDPKMTAPSEFRSVTGQVQTRIPGVTFGGTFPKLAALADKVSVVRSYVPGDGNHDIKPVVGRDSFGANLGSIYSRVAGRNHPDTGMPTNVLLLPRSVDPSTQPGTQSFGRFASTGMLGNGYAPFDPSTGSTLQSDMRLALPMSRLTDRRALLNQLDEVQWGVAERATVEGMDRMREQALTTVLGGVADAFDLSKEDPRLVAAYDTSELVKPQNIDRRWNNYNNYVDNANTLGKLLLLARRLCERGAGFVTVTTNFVWDMHADVNNAPVGEGFGYMGVPLDHALSAFIEDVHARGLDDKILLVVCGEIGRTPRLNRQGGRDHWGTLAPLLVSGGGLRMGQVIGRSNANAGEPASQPVRIQNLIATIMHSMLELGEVRLISGLPREIALTMTGWDPIAGLV